MSATWLQTFTGKQFRPLEPTPEMICIEDIAHGLAGMRRFSGQTMRHYSVADHSIHVSEIVEDPQLRFAALLHDASEAFIADIPAPIKPHIKGYAEIEERIMRAVAKKFGVDFELFAHPLVKKADLVALATEKRDLMGPEPVPWIPMPLPDPRPLVVRTDAEEAFLKTFFQLRGGR